MVPTIPKYPPSVNTLPTILLPKYLPENLILYASAHTVVVYHTLPYSWIMQFCTYVKYQGQHNFFFPGLTERARDTGGVKKIQDCPVSTILVVSFL